METAVVDGCSVNYIRGSLAFQQIPFRMAHLLCCPNSSISMYSRQIQCRINPGQPNISLDSIRRQPFSPCSSILGSHRRLSRHQGFYRPKMDCDCVIIFRILSGLLHNMWDTGRQLHNMTVVHHVLTPSGCCTACQILSVPLFNQLEFVRAVTKYVGQCQDCCTACQIMSILLGNLLDSVRTVAQPVR